MQSPLHLAASNGHKDVVQHILTRHTGNINLGDHVDNIKILLHSKT